MRELKEYGKLLIVYFDDDRIFICPHHPVIRGDGDLIGFGDEGPVSELHRNSSIDNLQGIILENFERCNQYFLDKFPERLGIEMHLKVRSYKAATKDKKLVTILLNTDGYSISTHKTEKPTVFIPTETFEINETKAIYENFLAVKVLEAMDLST